MATRLEMLLYHGLATTGRLELSATSSSGPWTPVTLTETRRVTEALAEWQFLANQALPAVGWVFTVDHTNALVGIESTDAPGWVRLSPCLAELLGFGHVVIDAYGPEQSDQQPLGLLCERFDGTHTGLAVGSTFPVEVEEAELNEYRGGRASSYHYGRACEVTLDIFLSAETWEVIRETPMLSAHAAFYLEDETDAEFNEDLFNGAMTLYPLELVGIEQDSPDDVVAISMRCVLRDEDEEAPAYFYRVTNSLVGTDDLPAPPALQAAVFVWFRIWSGNGFAKKLCASGNNIIEFNHVVGQPTATVTWQNFAGATPLGTVNVGQWYALALIDGDGVTDDFGVYLNAGILIGASASGTGLAWLDDTIGFGDIGAFRLDLRAPCVVHHKVGATERYEHFALGPEHDPRIAHAAWTAADLALAWLDPDDASEIPNAGTAGDYPLAIVLDVVTPTPSVTTEEL